MERMLQHENEQLEEEIKLLKQLEEQSRFENDVLCKNKLEKDIRQVRNMIDQRQAKICQLQVQAEDINRMNILQALSRERHFQREETVMKPSAQKVIRIDKGRIINYDFTPLENKLNQVLDWFGMAGALSLKIRLENMAVLEDFVIPRIKQELKSKIIRIDRREWDEKIIVIDSSEIGIYEDEREGLIEKLFIEKYKDSYNQFAEWIDDSPKDLLLIVKIYKIQIEDIIEECWQKIYAQVEHFLRYRCLVTIFVHSFPGSKPYINSSNNEFYEHKIIPLPLKAIPVEHLEKWFRGELHQWGLDEKNPGDAQRIKDYVDRLKEHCGDISKTFHELNIICSQLQDKGRIIYNAK